jgi:hypothetical protein
VPYRDSRTHIENRSAINAFALRYTEVVLGRKKRHRITFAMGRRETEILPVRVRVRAYSAMKADGQA